MHPSARRMPLHGPHQNSSNPHQSALLDALIRDRPANRLLSESSKNCPDTTTVSSPSSPETTTNRSPISSPRFTSTDIKLPSSRRNTPRPPAPVRITASNRTHMPPSRHSDKHPETKMMLNS